MYLICPIQLADVHFQMDCTLPFSRETILRPYPWCSLNGKGGVCTTCISILFLYTVAWNYSWKKKLKFILVKDSNPSAFAFVLLSSSFVSKTTSISSEAWSAKWCLYHRVASLIALSFLSFALSPFCLSTYVSL